MRTRPGVIVIAAAVGGAGLAGTRAGAETIDPRGLFFHAFTGSAAGSEWATWGALGPPDRYEFSDLRSSGAYQATFAEGGSFTLDGGSGAGSFSDQDHGVIDFTLGPGTNFHSVLTRAPYTDAGFPVFFTSAVTGDASLAGSWDATVRLVNPATGAIESSSAASFGVTVTGTTVRFTNAAGAYYQGVWMGGSRAGFRVIDRVPADAKYRTFPGSATSINQNMLGELRVGGANAMTLTLFFETRRPFPQQTQTMQVIELTRAPAPGAPSAVLGAGALALRRRRPASPRR